jgi:peptide/nickel transport system permease protein
MNARREWLVVLGRAARSPRGRVGLGLTLLVVLFVIIGPFVEPYKPLGLETGAFAKPSGAYPLGADDLGRDVLSRLLAGGWLLIVLAVAATAIGVGIGVWLGIAAAYFGRFTDGVIMRIVDIFLAFPQLVFALLLVSVLGNKLWLIIVAVGISHAPQVARVIRSVSLDVCERDFVKAVELYDTPGWRVMFSEILPNVMTVVMVEIGLRFTYSILIIASMTFLGFGIQPPAASWARMIEENQIGLVVNPWAVIAPAVMIALLTIGTNTFTDAVGRASLGVDRPVEELTLGAGVELEAVA